MAEKKPQRVIQNSKLPKRQHESDNSQDKFIYAAKFIHKAIKMALQNIKGKENIKA